MIHEVPEVKEFIARCRGICGELGSIQPAYICGFIGREARVWADNELEISCDNKSPMMEIRLLPAIHPDNLENSVVMVNEKGKTIRTHGEWVYARVKVDRLYRGLESVIL